MSKEMVANLICFLRCFHEFNALVVTFNKWKGFFMFRNADKTSRVLCQSLVRILIDSPMLGGQSIYCCCCWFFLEQKIYQFHFFNEAIYLSVNHILFIYFSWMKISSQWRWLAMRLGTCQKATPWTCLKTLFQCVFFPSQIKVRIMIHMIHVLKFIHIPYWEFYVLFLVVHSSLLLFLLYFSDACCIKRFRVGVINSIWKKIRNVKLWNGNVLGAACIG